MHCPLPVLCLCHDQPVLLLLSFFHLSGRTISKYISLLYLATRLDMPICASSGSQVKCCLAINNCDTDNLVPPDTGISICSCLPHRTSTFLLVIYMIVIVSTFHNKFGLFITFNWSPNTVLNRYLSNGRSNKKISKNKVHLFLYFGSGWPPPPVNWSPSHSTDPQTPF